MDPDRVDLITCLCTQAGMIMEDASMLAITMPARADDRIGDALERLAADIASMASLIAAATTLYRRE